MGVPKKIDDVENEMQKITSNSNYIYLELLPKNNPKQCYYAKVMDNQGYLYRMNISEIKNNRAKDPFKNNPFVEENYLNYVSKNFKDIIVENFSYKDRHSLINFHCIKHAELGTQCVKAKQVRNRNCLCIHCVHESVGECNSYNKDDINLISKMLEQYDCDLLSVNSSKSIVFRCRKHNTLTQQRSLANIRCSKTPCLECNRIIQSTITRQDVNSILKHPKFDEEKIEILGEYVGSEKKILCICNYCNHQWYVTPNKLKQGRGCPMCANQTRSVKPLSEAKNDLAQKYPTIKIVGNYINTHTPADFKCLACDTIWTTTFQSIYYGNSGCPLCNSTYGEYVVAVYLNNNNIKYLRQFTFSDCRFQNPLRFDFYLPDHNTVIEYQGEQHYYPVKFNAEWNDQELQRQFQYTQTRDDIKRNYCKEQGINMVEIPYWDKNNIGKYLDKIA